MTTALLSSDKFKQHETGPGFPESPARLDAIMDHLNQSKIIDELKVIEPTIADKDNALLIHDREYLERVREACDLGAPIVDTADNPISKYSYDIALLAAGAMTQAVDNVMEVSINNAMVLPRPPGHHAEKNQAMGFCLFNNVAIAARYAQKNYDIEKVAIIDFDVHHGNGTQHIFDDDPNVFYFSTHQYPFFPGTGTADEIGIGPAKGTKFNYPLPFSTNNDTIIDIYKNILPEKIMKFDPEFIVVSAGFDAHFNDPIGGFEMTTEGFYEISKVIVQIADETCDGKIVSSLEGGYNIKALAESVGVHLLALQGK